MFVNDLFLVFQANFFPIVAGIILIDTLTTPDNLQCIVSVFYNLVYFQYYLFGYLALFEPHWCILVMSKHLFCSSFKKSRQVWCYLQTEDLSENLIGMLLCF